MSALRNIPLARKFVAAFGLVCLLCVFLSVSSILTFRAISADSQDVSDS